MNSDVLIDTSAWFEFFQRGEGPVAYAVYRLVREDRGVVAGVIVAELLQATTSEKQKDNLKRHISTLRYVEDDRRDWALAGSLVGKLRRRGVAVPLTDSLLSVLCVRHNLAILTLDKHFAHFNDMQWFAVK
jgi:predicted nucleic acid-binding protein